MPAKAEKTAKAASDAEISIEIEQSKLMNALQAVAPAFGRSVIPILDSALFEVTGGDLTITATDHDVWIREKVETQETIGNGRFLAPFKRMLAFTSHADGMMSIKSKRGRVIIQCGKAKADLQTFKPDDYPELPATKAKGWYVEGAAIAKAFRAIGKTQSDNDGRFTLATVNFEVKNDLFCLASSDGHRFGYAEMLRPDGAPECRLLIHKRAIPAFLAIAGEDELKFSADENSIFVETKTRLMITRLQTGQFPNIDIVLKNTKSHPTEVKVNGFAALNAISRISAACETKTTMSMAVTLKGGALHFRIDTPDVGTAEDSINVEYDGEPITFHVNRKYFIDALSITDEPVLRIKNGEEPVELLAQSDHMRALHIVCLINPKKSEAAKEAAKK
jgi:DNA polymerase-3 subunit beta